MLPGGVKKYLSHGSLFACEDLFVESLEYNGMVTIRLGRPFLTPPSFVRTPIHVAALPKATGGIFTAVKTSDLKLLCRMARLNRMEIHSLVSVFKAVTNSSLCAHFKCFLQVLILTLK
jgi:hypothetical protein